MNLLITGCAGFIGYHTCENLLKNSKYNIVGIDNLNNYYEISLKKNRLKNLKKNKKFKFFNIDISSIDKLKKIFKKFKISYVVNLAAQAGVRYSIENRDQYFKSNIIGFYNLLEMSKYYKVKHFIFASSSSVYGNNNQIPFDEKQITDFPLSFYAATKKTNEILAYPYSYLFKMKITGIRFFTVYGPYGRPDMALFKFVNSLLNRKPIELYNFGKHLRDFTYIDDVTNGIFKIIFQPPNKKIPYEIVNLGRGKPEKLKDFLNSILHELKILKPKIIRKKLQQGDTISTFASTKKMSKNYSFKANTNLKYGINKFVNWYRNYYNK